jgi:hypothetical protein
VLLVVSAERVKEGEVAGVELLGSQLLFDLDLAIVVGSVHRCSQVGSCARAIRNLAKQRPRVGPMLPCGIPSALANSA